MRERVRLTNYLKGSRLRRLTAPHEEAEYKTVLDQGSNINNENPQTENEASPYKPRLNYESGLTSILFLFAWNAATIDLSPLKISSIKIVNAFALSAYAPM